MSLDITRIALPERKRILVVEDLEALRRLYAITLSAHFEVDDASNAIIALEKIVNDRPLAVVLDIRMPGRMSGLDLCRHIKASDNFRDIKVVIVTGSGQPLDRQAGIRLGADAFFQKPLSPSALLGCLLSLTEPH
jgi:CheY-like chemotaxis protein